MAIVINGTGTITGISATDGLSSPQTGSVLQVVQGVLGSQFGSTSTSFVSTGLTASITPKFATSKILVSFTSQAITVTDGSIIAADIYKNGVSLSGESTYGYIYIYTAGAHPAGLLSFQYLNSPATTSSTTYTIYARSNSSANTWYFGGNGSANAQATITLMEIAA
jgi:hypothetical protein